jgi:GT2 family glycosyltransferase
MSEVQNMVTATNIVCITTIRDALRTVALCHSYLTDPATNTVLIYDNGHEKNSATFLQSLESIDARIKYVDTRGLRIYGQWNLALRYAMFHAPSNIIISNDDIAISDGLVSKLAKHIRSSEEFWIAYPALSNQFTGKPEITVTHGTAADGGMAGYCFMVKGECFSEGLPYVDERFLWWGGDDDLARNVEKLGKKQIRCHDASVHHDWSSTSRSAGFEWIYQEAIPKDIELLSEKWGIYRKLPSAKS